MTCACMPHTPDSLQLQVIAVALLVQFYDLHFFIYFHLRHLDPEFVFFSPAALHTSVPYILAFSNSE